MTDTIIIPLGFTAAIPWLLRICVLFNVFQSAHYTLSDDIMEQMTGNATGSCKACTKWMIVIFGVIFTCIIFFTSLGDVFDYEKEGFFSYQGGSQRLKTVLFLCWQIQVILNIIMSCRLKNMQNILNENVKSMSEQDSMISNSGL